MMTSRLIKKACIACLPVVPMLLSLSLPAQSQVERLPRRSKRIPRQLVLGGKVRTFYDLGDIGANLLPRRHTLSEVGSLYNGLNNFQSFIAEPGEITFRGYSYPYNAKTNTPYANHTDPNLINVHILYGKNFKCAFVLHKPPQQNRRCIIPSRQRVYFGVWLKRVAKTERTPLDLRDVVVIDGPAAKNLYKTTYPELRARELAALDAGADRLGGGTGNKCVGSAFNGC